MEKIKSISLIFMIYMVSFVTYAGSQTIEVKNGVKYIQNVSTNWGNESKVKLEFVVEIGGDDVKNENYIMSDIKDVVKDKEGNIFIIIDKDRICVKEYKIVDL